MWQTIGQSKVVNLLQRAIESGSLAHAYLIIGPPHIGKMTLAKDLASALNCQSEKARRPCGECVACSKIAADKHTDVQIISLNSQLDPEESKERKEIGIEQIKDMLHSANLPPFEGTYRVYIIDEAGNLSIDAANRLLKTLEEPPARVVFVLLTSNPRLIPATVISRCQQLSLTRLNTAEIESLVITRGEMEPEKAKLVSRLSGGCPGLAMGLSQSPDLTAERREKFSKMLELLKSNFNGRFTVAAQLALQFGKKRETVYETLDTWAGWWRDLLLVKTGCADNINSVDFLPDLVKMAGDYNLVQIKEFIQNILEAGEQLKLNANPRLVMEALMLNIPQLENRSSTKTNNEVKCA